MKLYAVGIGPGKIEGMTAAAHQALEESDLLVGYGVYLELVRDVFQGKETYESPMRQEVDRCRVALERAAEGRKVSVLCSGDAGVYGMASLLLEMAPSYPDVEIEIVPGVTAALSGAALLGAPLGHDFAVISLSDLLTPWPLIEKRLSLAAEAGLVICLYNPSSKKRQDHLCRACQIAAAHLPPETVCGAARRVGREGEEMRIMPLAELETYEADMFTTVFIGTKATRAINGRMVTPRGYRGQGL